MPVRKSTEARIRPASMSDEQWNDLVKRLETIPTSGKDNVADLPPAPKPGTTTYTFFGVPTEDDKP